MLKYLLKLQTHLFYLILLFTVVSSSYPQTKTNLEIFYSLADSSINQFIASCNPSSTTKVQLKNGLSFSIFDNEILGKLKSAGIESLDRKDSVPVFSYSIEDAMTQYTDIYRDGFLGPYMVNRVIHLSGNYFYSGTGKKEFNFHYSDTIKVDDIKELENTSYSFTKGALPTEPFFTGLFEPVVALATTAAAVVLFFTVRSR
jgi:hypothetical protein